MYADRNDAAKQLSRALAHLRGTHPLVVGIPRGAMPMAARIAADLDGDLDVVLVRKLGAPWNPELALGAVDESGHIHLNAVARELGIDRDDLTETAGDELARIRARRARYGEGRPALDPNGRVVIVVDDGLATGATMHAALAALRARKPARLICALPVAAADSLRREVSGMADEVVCLSTPDDFLAVGQYYRYFPQVGDDEVVALLRQKARS